MMESVNEEVSSYSGGYSGGSSNTIRSNRSKVYCRCNVVAPLRVSTTPENPGRRFYGYSNFKDAGKFCRFIQWYDEVFTERSVSVINGLKADLMKMKLAQQSESEQRMREELEKGHLESGIDVKKQEKLVLKNMRLKENNMKLKKELAQAKSMQKTLAFYFLVC